MATQRRLEPGELVFVAPDTGLYPAHDDADDVEVPSTDDWKLALIIGTDHITSCAGGQHNWFMVLIDDALHYIGRHCIMTLDQPLSRIGQ